MKQIEFKTSKGEFVVVELNEREQRGIDCNPMMKLISRIPDITEDQAKEVVDDKEGNSFTDYEVDQTENDGYYYKKTAIESLNSLLEVNGVVFDICKFSYCTGVDNENSKCITCGDLAEVFNKNKTYIFKKI